MENREAQQAVEAILVGCQEALGQELKAAYLYGSLANGTFTPGESDINLLLVLTEEADLHGLRRAYGPIWRAYRAVSDQSPVILRHRELRRHLQLFPLLAQHLKDHGRLLAGADCLEHVPEAAALEPLSRLAGQVMATSAALAPELLPPAERQTLLTQLRRRFRQTTGRPAPDGTPAAQLVGQLARDLERQITAALAQQPAAFHAWPVIAAPSDAPSLLPRLLAIYEIEDRLILVLPGGPAADLVALISHIDWPAVAGSVGQHYRSLHITTPNQLRLNLYYDTPAAHFFGRYVHAWGGDFLASLDIPVPLVLRDLSRRPAEIRAVVLPHAYLTAEDAELPQLIHDLQNRLLNIQLQQELFSRLDGRPRAHPAEALPGREFEPAQRIDAILGQLDWWSEYYFSALQPAEALPTQ